MNDFADWTEMYGDDGGNAFSYMSREVPRPSVMPPLDTWIDEPLLGYEHAYISPAPDAPKEDWHSFRKYVRWAEWQLERERAAARARLAAAGDTTMTART